MALSMQGCDIAEYIKRTVSGGHLSSRETRTVVGFIMDGLATPAQVSALLVALALNGETLAEVIGAARAMRDRATPVRCTRSPLIDVCGTGGDGCGSFNISTAATFIIAGAGVAVAKHGNRAMSSRCGSADVVEALGIDLLTAAAAAQTCLERHGCAFLFAQALHPAMRHVAPVRQQIGVRTLFNLVGPLANPADLTHQVVGVPDERLMPLLARALRALGRAKAAVLCGADGMDEISLSCPSRVLEWTGSAFVEYEVTPEMAGLQRRSAANLAGGDALRNACIIEAVLSGVRGDQRDVAVLNAALALQIAGAAPTLAAGAQLAEQSIDSGAAYAALAGLRSMAA